MPDDAMRSAPNPYAALGIPNFRRYIVGLLAFTMAIQIQGTVVGWQIYELTHDKLALGLIGLAEAIPFIGMSLYAGHVADKHDRRRIALTALVVLTACSAALLLLPLFLSRAPQTVTRAIYAVIVTSGFARAFLQPARQALGAEIVPRALYANAVTWRSGSWQLASVLGPALGGVLYAAGGAPLAYAVDVTLTVVGFTFTVMLLPMLASSFLKADASAASTASSTTSLGRFFSAESCVMAMMKSFFIASSPSKPFRCHQYLGTKKVGAGPTFLPIRYLSEV